MCRSAFLTFSSHIASEKAFLPAYMAVMWAARDWLVVTPSSAGSLSSMMLGSLGCFPNTSWKLLKPPYMG